MLVIITKKWQFQMTIDCLLSSAHPWRKSSKFDLRLKKEDTGVMCFYCDNNANKVTTHLASRKGNQNTFSSTLARLEATTPDINSRSREFWTHFSKGFPESRFRYIVMSLRWKILFRLNSGVGYVDGSGFRVERFSKVRKKEAEMMKMNEMGIQWSNFSHIKLVKVL